MTINCVLFDLDGTLIDTSYDFCHALKLTCEDYARTPPTYSQVREIVSEGGLAVTKLGFPDLEGDELEAVKDIFLQHYTENIAKHSHIFPGLEIGLKHLAKNNIPWGIVTNKPERFTHKLMEHLDFPSKPISLVCSDTLPVKKPNPEPLWYAAKEAGVAPEKCIYFGDHARDIEAGINAKMLTGAALFGYLKPQDLPGLTQANHSFHTPYEMSKFIINSTN